MFTMSRDYTLICHTCATGNCFDALEVAVLVRAAGQCGRAGHHVHARGADCCIEYAQGGGRIAILSIDGWHLNLYASDSGGSDGSPRGDS